MRNADCAEKIVSREPFVNSTGSFSGIVPSEFYRVTHTTYLPSEKVRSLNAMIREGEIDYIVVSYDTPIGWHSKHQGWELISRKMSPTTSKHQAIMRGAFS